MQNQSPKPKRVMFFVTCMVDQLAPHIGQSAVRVLERHGVEVVFPTNQTCCGQPAYNSGFATDAHAVAKRFLDVFEGDDPIVVPSGSCGAMVRNYYKDLFRDEPELLEKAAAIAARTYEFTEFLVQVLGVDELPGGGRLTATATYHQCCHLLRELGVDEEPKTLLERVDGLVMREMEQSEVCCGFGGTFAVKFPEISTGMLNDKLDHAKATGSEMLIAGDTGCILHMNGGIRRRGDAIRAMHIAEVLDQAGVGVDDSDTNRDGVPSGG